MYQSLCFFWLMCLRRICGTKDMEVECLSSVMEKGEDNSEFSGVTVAVD